MSGNLERAIMLLQQNRPKDAEKFFRAELAENPDSPVPLAYLALCLDDPKAALQYGERAVGLDAELPLAYFAVAQAQAELGAIDKAHEAMDEALRLEPDDVFFLGFVASLYARKRNWRATLEMAERGLELEPEDVDCINLRALALGNLGEGDSAEAAIDTAIAHDPNNASSHANKGWQLLRAGEHREAEQAFLEALRIDPELEWARKGVLEALKARNVFYRQMQRYLLWMAGLTDKAQWAVVIGIFVGQRILRGVAEAAPEAKPFLLPIIALLAFFIYMTWAATPISTLTLFLHPLGRHALKRAERISAILVGLCLLSCFALIGAFFGMDGPRYLMGAVACALLVIPIAGTARLNSGAGQKFFAAVTGLLAISTSLGIFMPTENYGVYFAPVFISIFVLSIALNIAGQRQP